MEKLNRFLKGLLSVYTVVIALLICWQCVDIYRDAYSPEMLSDRGTLLAPVYTPEKISVRLGGVLAVSAAYPVVLICTLALGKYERRGTKGTPVEPEYTLMRMKKRLGGLPESALREEKYRKHLRLGRMGVLIMCAAGSAAYLLNRNNFASWDLEPVMGGMLKAVLPWAVIALGSVCVFSELERRSAVREAEILRDAPKIEKKRQDAEKKPPFANTFRWVMLGAAVLLVIMGIINGDPRSVMTKAIRICTECIGLG